MESPAAEAPPSIRDNALLALAALIFAGGLFSFYYFDPSLPQIVRLLLLLAAIGITVGVAYQTRFGKSIWEAIAGSRQELRKVVWPTRQESVQTTLLIAVVVLIMSLLMWGLDSILLFGVEQLTGRG